MFQSGLILITALGFTQFLSTLSQLPPITRKSANGPLIIQLIDNCLPKSRTIGLIGDSKEITESPLFLNSLKSYLILPTPKENEEEIPQLSRVIAYNVDAYVVMASPSDIGSTFRNLIRQPWWQKGKLVIMAESGASRHSDSCNTSWHFVIQAAYFYVVNAILLCHHMNHIPVLYSYIRGTEYLPKQWRYVANLTSSVFAPSIVIIRQYYDDSQEFCQSLTEHRKANFTRLTMNVVGADSPPYIYLLKHKSVPKVLGLDGSLFTEMKLYFNFTGLILHVDNKRDININARALDKLTVYLATEYDLLLNSLLCQPTVKFDHTYPHFWTQVSVVTKLKDNKGTLERIFDFMPPYIIIILIGTGIFGCLMLRYIFHDGFQNIMDTLALLLNISVTRLPIGVPGRLFFTPILLLFLITNSVFQGNLSNLLTVPVQQRNVEKIEDLNEFGYKVIGTAHVESSLNDVFHGNLTSLPHLNFTCANLQENEAYMDDAFHLELSSDRKNCHIPKVPFFTTYRCLYVKKNWPLLPAVNRFIQLAWEVGLMKKIRRVSEWAWDKHARQWWMEINDYRRPLRLQDLYFVFILLLIGLALSLMAFLLEILSARGQRKWPQFGMRLWIERVQAERGL